LKTRWNIELSGSTNAPLYACTMAFAVFDLGAVISTGILWSHPEVYPSSEWPTQLPEMCNARAQRERSLLFFIRLSCTSNASIRSINSISCMSGVSPTPRLGVAEDWAKNAGMSTGIGRVGGVLLRAFWMCRVLLSGWSSCRT